MLQWVFATVELVSETVAPGVAEPAHEVAEAKMPQLAFETFPMQIFWLAVVFSIFYLILSRYALPRLGKVIGKRSQSIDQDIDAAKKLHTESEQIIAELDVRIAQTQTAINEKLAKEHNELRAKSASQEALEMAELSGKLHESEKFILRGKERAFDELRRQTPEIVVAAVQRLMGENPKLDDIDKEIATAIQLVQLKGQGAVN
ncbi:MAG: hypothetical protein ORO03_11460 [Alphaproteobacteria bacterium]|nr:hypothetical protein [Alphaproteobacteria bacterium]